MELVQEQLLTQSVGSEFDGYNIKYSDVLDITDVYGTKFVQPEFVVLKSD